MYVPSEGHSCELFLWILRSGYRLPYGFTPRTIWWNTTVGFDCCYFPRTIYLGYDLSFSHCIDKVYEELKQHFANVLKGEVVHSQNLSYSEHFDSEYIRFGYHYFKTATRDPNGILVFLCKDNTDVSNYFVNGNLYSVLLDSGLSQALAFTDSQLMAVVLMNF